MPNNFDHLQGWCDRPADVNAIMAVLPMPVFGEVYGELKNSGRGKIVLLYQCVEKVAGSFHVRLQTIGDCVSMGAACAVDTLKATEIVIKGDLEEWIGDTATEDIYGGSRIQIGNGQLGYGDGSVGAWAAQYVSTYGTLVRKNYGSVDLTTYDGERARRWGNPGAGCPRDLLVFAKEHLVKTVSQVRNYEEARDAIANGYPITVASNQGFTKVRDNDGFARPEGNWGHQMCFTAVDDSFKRPGLLCQNSWGTTWISGPKRNGQPDGSFWVDADTVNRMLGQNDSWAYSNFDGFQLQELSLDWV
jgi:hypothetical protein